MNLKFKRKLSKSLENRAAVISIPRSIVQSWEKYNAVELVFDGDHLIITPTYESKQPMEMSRHDEDA
jgi:hypothetical protein